MSDFLRDEVSLADLVSRMPAAEQARYRKFGHLQLEAAFAGRVFIAYSPTGLNALGNHREPHVLTTMRVSEFSCTSKHGSQAVLVDESNGLTMRLDHVPRRLFEYDVYMAIPPRMQLRWDARVVSNDVVRSLSFAVLIKTKNRSDFYSAGNIYLETPNRFLKLYPNANGAGRFVFS